jgi:predicted ATPase
VVLPVGAGASRLVGRAAEWARLEQLASAGGIVTLTGPGGVGKSRLAADFVSAYQDRTGDAVTMGLLAAVHAGSGAEPVVDALGFESLDAAAVVLADRKGIVVLDNCEHVLEAARAVAAEINSAADSIVVLATSREPLGVAGEQVLVVEPLALPAEGGADAEQTPSVALFLERAAAAGANLEPSTGLLADVAELCRRLDGLPLAIELAAARTRAISPGDLLTVVDQRLDLLRRTHADGARHQSMRAAIELSTSLLAPDERRFFRRLGVFTGPFDVGLATAVAGDADQDRLTSLDLLARLVERSLVTAETHASTTRYRLLELLREHAVEELASADELDAVQERFVTAMVAAADHIVARALTKWDPILLGAASVQYANLVRACELCLERDPDPARAYRLLLPMFAAVHEGRPNEVWHLGCRVRERWPDDAVEWRPEVLAVLATAAAIAGRSDQVEPLARTVTDDPAASSVALALAHRAWGLAARADDPLVAAEHFQAACDAGRRSGFASLALEVQAFRAGELDVAGRSDEALVELAEVLRRGHESDDVFVVVLAHLVRARVLLRAGDVDAAQADLALARSASAAMGQPWWTAAVLRTAAAIASFGPGGWASSRPLWRRAIDFAASRGALGEVAITLRTAASIAKHLGEDEQAAVLFAAVPRSMAITVLPELFPQAMAELQADAPSRAVGVHLRDALDRARSALAADPATAAATSPPTSTAPVASSGSAPEPAPPPGPELVAEGDSWRVGFMGRTVRVRDMKGIADLAVLFARPGVEVHALELMGGHDVGSTAGPLLDERARREYQARIVDLQHDIDEARADHDNARAERAEHELDALVEQLSEAFGLGGRSRTTGSSAERARTAVTYRIRSAIRKLDQLHPDLGRHLTNSVRTGTWCCYRPETEVLWTIERRGLTV